jgi:hypothetical protein
MSRGPKDPDSPQSTDIPNLDFWTWENAKSRVGEILLPISRQASADRLTRDCRLMRTHQSDQRGVVGNLFGVRGGTECGKELEFGRRFHKDKPQGLKPT